MSLIEDGVPMEPMLEPEGWRSSRPVLASSDDVFEVTEIRRSVSLPDFLPSPSCSLFKRVNAAQRRPCQGSSPGKI
jgi:hypothetical protein